MSKLPDAPFDGDDYVPKRDDPRLRNQIDRIFDLMKDEKWRTVDEIHAITKDKQTSISAQLRHMRKPKFGLHTVNRRHRGEPARGLYEFQVIENTAMPPAPTEQMRMIP